jgi:2-keto-4-pentenoate hydratase/2-oxohepta-3-ene-1,7-dioic acid hydratase in catechol pathway
LVDGRIVDLCATDSALPKSVRQILSGGESAIRAAEKAASSASAVVRDRVGLKSPIVDPPKVVCIGLNYRDHAQESGAPIPKEPVVFNKFPTAIIGPDEPIVLPAASERVDYEAELVVVIGRQGKNISVGSAMDYVAGYTIGHDVSARDWQLEKDGKQWLLGKSFDTFAPMGPALVTKDEVLDPCDLDISLRLNGQTMQSSNTRQLIFPVAVLASYVSQVATLLPGDVIFTGTPAGVGFARKPPVFLQPGDVCEIEIAGLGVLRNPCIRGGPQTIG